MKRKIAILLLCVMMVVSATLLSGCDLFNTEDIENPSYSPVSPAGIEVTSLSLSEQSLRLKIGQNQTLSVTINPSNATNKTITWKSTNTSVATVNNGVITAVGSGTTVITATSSNGKSVSCNVGVYKPFTSIKLATDLLSMNVGKSYTFRVSCLPYDASEKVFLKTENPDIISIGSNGTITALKTGTARVYLESESGLTSYCTVTCADIEKIETPLTLNNWSNPAYFKTETATFSKLDFWFEANASSYLGPSIKYNLTAKKTYCYISGSYEFKINYKVYDPNNTVIRNGTITTSAFAVGETTSITGTIYLENDHVVVPGEYRIVLSEVAW